jgi:hypothetical protein
VRGRRERHFQGSRVNQVKLDKILVEENFLPLKKLAEI